MSAHFVYYAWVRTQKDPNFKFIVSKVSPAGPNSVGLLRQFATKWVEDEVGKNNFVDTLDSNKTLSQYPVNSYVLQFDTDKNQINLHWTNAQSWMNPPFSCGYFTVTNCADVESDSQTQTIAHLNHFIGVSDMQFSSLNMEFRATLDEVNKLRSELQKYENKVSAPKLPAAPKHSFYDQLTHEIQVFDKNALRKTRMTRAINLTDSCDLSKNRLFNKAKKNNEPAK